MIWFTSPGKSGNSGPPASGTEGDPGAVIIGHYSVQDDAVVLHAADGKPTAKRHHLSTGEDPKQAAWRLTRDAKAVTPDFNRRLNYQPLGIT